MHYDKYLSWFSYGVPILNLSFCFDFGTSWSFNTLHMRHVIMLGSCYGYDVAFLDTFFISFPAKFSLAHQMWTQMYWCVLRTSPVRWNECVTSMSRNILIFRSVYCIISSTKNTHIQTPFSGHVLNRCGSSASARETVQLYQVYSAVKTKHLLLKHSECAICHSDDANSKHDNYFVVP